LLANAKTEWDKSSDTLPEQDVVFSIMFNPCAELLSFEAVECMGLRS
jgi:hypothetical protein